MKNRVVLMLTFLGICAIGFAQDEHKKALELYKQGKYADAIVMLEESIASHPDWFYPIVLKGQANLKLGKYSEALGNFNDALTLEVPSKDIPLIKYYTGKAYMALEDFPKAIHTYNDLLPLVPSSRHFDIYLNRGQCEMQIATEAEEANDSKKANSFYSKAVVSFTEALKTSSKNKEYEIEAAFQKAYAQYKIGNLKGGIKSLEDSITAFQEVLRRNEKEERAHRFLVDLGFQIAQNANDAEKPRHYQRVVEYIDRFLANWPNNPEMMMKKGQALQGAKKYEEATDVFQLVVKLMPDNGNAFFSLGSCQMAANQYPEAIKSLRQALTKGQRDNHNIYSFMAYSYQQQKTSCYQTDIPLYEEAVRILEEGIQAVSGQSKEILRKDLARKKDNLAILKDNRATDEQNHLAALENIRNLSKTIAANRDKLGKNREMYIQQPTEELKSAIANGEAAIKSDEASLAKEVAQLSTYVNDAKKCGGSKSFKYYTEMVAELSKHQN